MSIETYTIEMKCSVTEEQHAAMLEVAMQSARDFKALAVLVAGHTRQVISCRTADAFYNEEEIDLIGSHKEIEDDKSVAG